MKDLSISKIKELFNQMEDDKFLLEYSNDKRKGVQKLVASIYRKKEKEKYLIEKYKTLNLYEEEAKKRGYQFICGIDEVGRGPLAGPVVAAAVILDPNHKILGLDDSKKLSETKREELYEEIKEKALSIGVSFVSNHMIDIHGIKKATHYAMEQAVQKGNLHPDYLLIDAEKIDIKIKQKSIIQGDSKSNSIAAASIVAKVFRDRYMKQKALDYPGYDFINNKGYGTSRHIEALKDLGPTDFHRKTFIENILK